MNPQGSNNVGAAVAAVINKLTPTNTNQYLNSDIEDAVVEMMLSAANCINILNRHTHQYVTVEHTPTGLSVCNPVKAAVRWSDGDTYVVGHQAATEAYTITNIYTKGW